MRVMTEGDFDSALRDRTITILYPMGVRDNSFFFIALIRENLRVGKSNDSVHMVEVRQPP